jgi:WD40 repeat protein/tRNA A-37 threonylcarbamoyl transferase component Bud32
VRDPDDTQTGLGKRPPVHDHDDETLSADDPAAAETMSPGDDRVPSVVSRLATVERSAYVELGEHARGGLGRILLARDERTGRQVAIKEMLRHGADYAQRFVREALVTANLQHPAIVPVYEVGRWPSGEPFYAMKLVRGRTLSEVIRGAKDRAARLALLPHIIAVADALAYAHGEGVVHRDLKPGNVLVGDFGETVVIDWGLARRRGEEVRSLGPVGPDSIGDETLVGTVLGTPAYMPPEQARGEPVDARADVYAIGAILYHLLAGRAPYENTTSADDTLARVLSEPAPPLQTLDAELPADLVTIVERAMAREARGRYASALELAEDLRRYVTGHLVSAHDYTLGERLRRWAARNRTAVVVSAVALLALLVIAGVSLSRVLQARDVAEAAQHVAEATSAASLEERARLELLADKPHRALPLLAEAMAHGRTGPVTRFLAGRALEPVDRVLGVRDVSVRGMSAAFVPGTDELAVGDESGVVRWRPGAGEPIWRSALVPTGDVVVAPRGEILVPTEKGVAVLRAGDGEELARLGDGPVLFVDVDDANPDTRVVAVLVMNGGLELWDLPARKRLHHADAPSDQRAVLHVAAEGKEVLVVTESGTPPLALWDLTTGKVTTPCAAEDGCGNGLLSPDGRWVLGQPDAQAGEAKTAGIVYEPATGTRKRIEVEGAIAEMVVRGDRLALVTLAATVELRDLASGDLIWQTKVPAEAYRVAFLPDGGALVVLDVEGGIHILDAATGVSLDRRQISGGIVTSMKLSPDGTRVLAFGSGGLLHVVSIASAQAMLVAPSPARVRTGMFSADRKLLAVSSQGGAVSLVDPATGKVTRRLEAHTANVLSMATTRGGELVTGGMDGQVVRWGLAAGDRRHTFENGTGVVRVRLSPHEDELATGGMDGQVKRWPLAGGEAKLVGKLDAPIVDVHWSGDGRRIAAFDDTATLRVWPARGGALLREVQKSEPGAAGMGVALRLSPDGEWLAYGGFTTAHVLFSVDNPARDVVLADSAAIKQGFGVAWSPDATRVAMGMNDRRARIWDAKTGQLHAVLEHGDRVVTVAFSPDGRFLVSGGLDSRAMLWDAEAGVLIATQPLPGNFFGAVFAPGGKSVVCFTSAAALLWRLPGFEGSAADLARIARCRSPWRLEPRGLVAKRAEPAECAGYTP